MLSRRRSTPPEARYLVLRVDGRAPEIARLGPAGTSSVYDPVSGRWVINALLRAQIHVGDDWQPARPEDIPAHLGIELDLPPPRRSGPRRIRRRRRPRGRHVHTGTD